MNALHVIVPHIESSQYRLKSSKISHYYSVDYQALANIVFADCPVSVFFHERFQETALF